MGAAAAPLTLRDFLELACESSSDGFRSYPRRLPCVDDDVDRGGGALQAAVQAPVRLLIEADLRRSPSRSLSSIFFPRSPRSLARISRLSRSLSRRLWEGFWRRRGDDDGYDGIDADKRESLGLPSPVVSSCSSSEAGDLLVVTEEKSASQSEKPSPSSSSTGSVHADGAAGDGQKAVDGDPVGRNLEMEDKQQLSPVSVMDFPFDDDDDREEGSDAGTCSPSFQQQCLPNLEGSSKAQLLHKIRRFEGLGQVVDPVDLEARFTAPEPGQSHDTHTRSNSSAATTTTPRSDGHGSINQEERESDEHRLLGRLLKDDAAASTDEISERLLLDFFAEGVDRLRALAGPVVGTARPPLDDHDGSALVRAAKEWVQGAGTEWAVGDVLLSGEAALADMELPGRRWMRVGAEERDVGAAVEGLVMNALVEELVRDLAVAAVMV